MSKTTESNESHSPLFNLYDVFIIPNTGEEVMIVNINDTKYGYVAEDMLRVKKYFEEDFKTVEDNFSKFVHLIAKESTVSLDTLLKIRENAVFHLQDEINNLKEDNKLKKETII